MTPHTDRAVGYGALRDLPLRDLLDELDRVERLLTQCSCPTASPDAGSPDRLGQLGRDLATEALRSRQRAVAAEIRRRPGGWRPRTHRSDGPHVSLESAAPPG